jgi:hypothetical protein
MIIICIMNMRVKGELRSYLFIGLGLVAVGELLVFLQIDPLVSWAYLFFWYGYIMFLDGAIYYRKGRSTIIDRPREFAAMLPISTGVWLIFEWYNLYLKNWHYENLPSIWWVAVTGSLISFATVIPGVLFTSELLEDVLKLERLKVKPKTFSRRALTGSVVFGALSVTVPLAFPDPYASYMFGWVWLGFFFLLDPINYWLKGDSLLEDLARGKINRGVSLLIGGAVCGFLWEFWNYWGHTKWIYDVPIASNLKLFEMPLPGYFGFPPFALELFAMYASLKLLYSYIRKAGGVEVSPRRPD